MGVALVIMIKIIIKSDKRKHLSKNDWRAKEGLNFPLRQPNKTYNFPEAYRDVL